MTSEFTKEMSREAQVRIDQYNREKEQLAKAPARIAELDLLIAEAESMVKSLTPEPAQK